MRKTLTVVYCWKMESVVHKKAFRLLLTDLSKASDFFSYQLLLVKSHGYWFSLATLRLILTA